MKIPLRPRHFYQMLLPAVLLAGYAATPAKAQPMDMAVVARSLGVECSYCHVNRGGDESSRARIGVARAMMDMTANLNLTIENVTGKGPGAATEVTCATCHRGVPIPKPMDQIMFETALREDGEAAIDVYHDLKERFYGHGVYDFSEQMLDDVINRMANISAEPALYLSALNIEQYPDSANAFVTLAYVYTRLLDDASAVAALRKALELDPDNNAARGRLSQLESYYPELRKQRIEDEARAEAEAAEEAQQ